MTIDEKYMSRCLQLALNGKGFTNPNPMVGAVIVHNNIIIGEGFHSQYGKAHAEVQAINNVRDKSLLKESTLYVSLEPCSHYGKTPPCSQLIMDSQIPRVMIACLDPYPEVSGRGINMLRNSGVEVEVGILEAEAKKLNKDFFTAQVKNRPYIYLKWAQTQDSFIDKIRDKNKRPQPTLISNDFSQMLVHKKRAEVSAIMVGTNTAVKDNPSLTTRYWFGKNPTRIILDRQGRIPSDYTLFDGKVRTIVFTERHDSTSTENVIFIQVKFDNSLFDNIFLTLKEYKINSILVEGGRELLQNLINKQLWDEACIETSSVIFGNGVKAPDIEGLLYKQERWKTSEHRYLEISDKHKIL